MQGSPTRRTVLQSASVGGVVALAGCLTAAGSEAADEPAESTTEHGSTPDDGASGPTDLEEWLLASNVVGGPVDRYFEEAVTVSVGTPHVPVAFQPADLRVTPGTTVEWIWSIHEDANNVVALDGSFDTGDPVAAVGTRFSRTFDEPGTYRYVSEPNAACGMRGVVRVEDVPESDHPAVDEWLADVDVYDGTVVDRTDEAAITVEAGAPGNGGHFAFDPPAVELSPGTTVTWEWTGEGGAHDVHFQTAAVAGSEITGAADASYSVTFEETGVYRYACRPHRSIGQKGAIVVE